VEGDSLHHRKGTAAGDGSAPLPLLLVLLLLRDRGTRGGTEAPAAAAEEEESRLALRRGKTGSISGWRDSNGGLLLM
jgi:hypothetical protein